MPLTVKSFTFHLVDYKRAFMTSFRVPAVPLDNDLHGSSSSTIIADGMDTSFGVVVICCVAIQVCLKL